MASLATNSTHPSPVYLVDFSVYKPPEELLVDRELAEERGKEWSVSALLPGVIPLQVHPVHTGMNASHSEQQSECCRKPTKAAAFCWHKPLKNTPADT